MLNTMSRSSTGIKSERSSRLSFFVPSFRMHGLFMLHSYSTRFIPLLVRCFHITSPRPTSGLDGTYSSHRYTVAYTCTGGALPANGSDYVSNAGPGPISPSIMILLQRRVFSLFRFFRPSPPLLPLPQTSSPDFSIPSCPPLEILLNISLHLIAGSAFGYPSANEVDFTRTNIDLTDLTGTFCPGTIDNFPIPEYALIRTIKTSYHQ